MEYLNKIELKGTVGRYNVSDVNGKSVARLSLAVNYAYKNKDGEAIIETTWFSVTVWEDEKNAHILAAIQTGTNLHVIGRVRMNRYVDQYGVERTNIDVLASKVEIID